MKKRILPALLLCVATILALSSCDIPPELIEGFISSSEHTHKFGDWIVEKEATCTEDGLMYRECDCGEEKTKVISAKGHSYGEWIDTVAAKCIEDGTVGHYHCTACNKDFDKNKNEITDLAIAAVGHNYVNGNCTLCKEREPSVGLKFTLSEDGTYYIVAGIGECTDTELIIPSTYEGLKVTTIEEYAFNSNINITSVVIQNGITTIEYGAFGGCQNLTSVTIPSSVVSIADLALASGLDVIKIDSGNTVYHCDNGCLIETATNTLVSGTNNSRIPSYVTSFKQGAFAYCTGLTSVTIPDSVTTIGEFAFVFCTSLSSITIPSSVTTIGESAFAYCTSLSSITIPSSVTTIGESAFAYCTSLSSITIPNSVTTIGDTAFGMCTSLSNITIPSSVASIGMGAFVYCSKLKSITVQDGNAVYHSKDNCIIETATNTLAFGCNNSRIPDYVTSIGDNAFWACTEITSITIPDGVTTICDYAFYDCSGLTSITIPDSVTSIGNHAFACANFETINYTGTQEQWNAINKHEHWTWSAKNMTINYNYTAK